MHAKADDYRGPDKFDYILLFGLITYLNDEQVKQVAQNCKNMLGNNGKLFIRNVTLSPDKGKRKFFKENKTILRFFIRLLTRKSGKYQLIRKNMNEELELFKSFDLEYTKVITGTGMRFYTLV